MIKIYSDYKKFDFVILVCQKLSNLLVNGLSIHQAIKILIQDEENQDARIKLTLLNQQINQGKSFIQGLSDFFPFGISPLNQIQDPPDITSFVQELGIYFKEKKSEVDQLLKEMTYPFLLLLGTSSVLIAFLVFFLPMFQQFFDDTNLKMPF